MTFIVSLEIQRDIGQKLQVYHTALVFDVLMAKFQRCRSFLKMCGLCEIPGGKKRNMPF